MESFARHPMNRDLPRHPAALPKARFWHLAGTINRVRMLQSDLELGIEALHRQKPRRSVILRSQFAIIPLSCTKLDY